MRDFFPNIYICKFALTVTVGAGSGQVNGQ